MNLIEWLPIKMAGLYVLVVAVMFYSCQPRVFSTACRSAALEPPNLSLPAVYPLAIPVLLPVRFKRGPLPESVRVLLVGTGILELLGCLALIPGFEIVELFLELGLELAFQLKLRDYSCSRWSILMAVA